MTKSKQLVVKADSRFCGIGYMLLFFNAITGLLKVGGTVNSIDSAKELFTDLRAALTFRADYVQTGAVEVNEEIVIFEAIYDSDTVKVGTHMLYDGLIIRPKAFVLTRNIVCQMPLLPINSNYTPTFVDSSLGINPHPTDVPH